MQRIRLTSNRFSLFFYKKDNGFTLMEMIIVIFLMGISLSLFLGFNFKQLDSVRLKSSGRDIFQFLKGARSQAMIDEKINTCTYYPDSKKIVQDLKKTKNLILPENVFLLFDRPEEEGSETNSSAQPIKLTSFYPDGTAIQAELFLKSGEKMITLSISPLLGKITIRSGGPQDEELEDSDNAKE